LKSEHGFKYRNIVVFVVICKDLLNEEMLRFGFLVDAEVWV